MTDTAVEVKINRHVADADVAIVVGPVFPHEVVGFSGGNKYFFPGVSGQELIDLSHWVGALITSAEMIGTPGVTPVRALINEAAAHDPGASGSRCAWSSRRAPTPCTPPRSARRRTPGPRAAEVSAETHVTYRDAPVQRVLSIMPTKYEDIWTAAKGFYKLEPIVADGGEVIIYAPHITEISVMHPHISEIGYHNRDYFLGQWERFTRPALGRSGALHPPARRRAPGARRTASATGSRDAGDRDPRGRRRVGQPRLPRPGERRRRRVRGGPGHLRRAPRRRGALPAASGRRTAGG